MNDRMICPKCGEPYRTRARMINYYWCKTCHIGVKIRGKGRSSNLGYRNSKPYRKGMRSHRGVIP